MYTGLRKLTSQDRFPILVHIDVAMHRRTSARPKFVNLDRRRLAPWVRG